MDKQDIAYISVQVGNSDVYRTFTPDFIKFSDPSEIGEMIQDMLETIENSKEELTEKHV